MNKLKITLLLFLFMIIFPLSAQDYLEDYLVTAGKNNPGLKARFNEYQAALERLPQVSSLPDPQLAFGYFIQPVETRLGPQQAKISISQMFPWFGTLNAQEEVAAQKAKTKYEAFKEAKARLFYEIKSAYYELYFTHQAVRITRENLDILSGIKRLTLVKMETGKASGVDELRIEMEMADLENKLALLLDKLYDQEVAFNNLLNVPADNKIRFSGKPGFDSLAVDPEQILDSIRLNNHELQQLDYRLSAFQHQETLARKKGKPDFSIGLDYILIGESDNSMVPPDQSGQDAFLFPKIGISLPLYRKKYTAMVKEVVLQQKATKQKKENQINTLETVFAKAETDYQDAGRRMQLFDKQAARAQKALNILKSEYATAGKDFEEILRMERQLLKYRLQAVKAHSDRKAAIAFIHYLMGRS